MTIIKPKNWSKFQHYKDRNPPWIKLHKDLLNDRDFMSLPSASIGLASLLWLLASESKTGEFDGSIENLAFRLRKTESEIKTNLKPLIKLGFFSYASTAQASDTESCSETETEGETETEEKTPSGDLLIPDLPSFIHAGIFQDFMDMRKKIKAPMTKRAVELLITKLGRMNDDGCDVNDAIEESIINSWKSVFPPKKEQTRKRKCPPAYGGYV